MIWIVDEADAEIRMLPDVIGVVPRTAVGIAIGVEERMTLNTSCPDRIVCGERLAECIHGERDQRHVSDRRSRHRARLVSRECGPREACVFARGLRKHDDESSLRHGGNLPRGIHEVIRYSGDDRRRGEARSEVDCNRGPCHRDDRKSRLFARENEFAVDAHITEEVGEAVDRDSTDDAE